MQIEITPPTEQDLPAIVSIQHTAAVMHRYSLAELKRDLAELSPELQPHFLIARQDGETVGFGNAHRTAGSYHPYKFQVEIYVPAERRGVGIGGRLYEALRAMLAPLDPISLRTQVSESDAASLNFATSRGFVETKRDFPSTLEISNFDPSRFTELEIQLAKDGVTFASLEEKDSPAFRRHWHEVFSEVRLDTPRADPISPIDFQFFERNVVNDEELLRGATVFAFRNGRIIGFSGSYSGARPGSVDQWLTGVVAKERGRGVALGLKLRVIHAAKAAGLSFIHTDNDTRNSPMLAVNDKLGFVRGPAVLSMLKDPAT